jgi:hypothetical protein
MTRNLSIPGLVALMLASLTQNAGADESENLAQQLNNPVADLISFPIQSNFDFKIGPSDGWRNTNNVQPVIPIGLNEDWNVISRTIVPVI